VEDRRVPQHAGGCEGANPLMAHAHSHPVSESSPMNLRVCDGEREQRVPASVELVEQAFASGVRIREGTETTLVEGERWLAALAVSGPAAGTARKLRSSSWQELPVRLNRRVGWVGARCSGGSGSLY
jgi:hypothetical protein